MYEPVSNQTANWSTESQTKLSRYWSVSKYGVRRVYVTLPH